MADSTVQALIEGQFMSCLNFMIVDHPLIGYSLICTSSPTITKPGRSGATGVAKASSGTSDKGKRVAVGAIGAIVGAALVI